MTDKHIQGPYAFDPTNGVVFRDSGDKSEQPVLAFIGVDDTNRMAFYGVDNPAEDEANGYLFAAAPEMLAELLTWCDACCGKGFDDCADCKTGAAIRKAWGGQ